MVYILDIFSCSLSSLKSFPAPKSSSSSISVYFISGLFTIICIKWAWKGEGSGGRGMRVD